MRIIVWLIVNTGALAVATWMLGGISMNAPTTQRQVVELVIAGCIFGIINSFLKPVLQVLSLPFIVLTLGFFLLVINALLLMLTSKISSVLGMGFHVEGFWTAILGSIIITLTSMLLNAILPEPEPQRQRVR